MSFREKIESVASISACYRIGLSGLKGEHRSKLKTNKTRNWSGSVNLDECYFQARSRASFDYLIGHSDKGYFIEVHPASTSEIETLIIKKQSIDLWLNTQAGSIKEILGSQPFIWLSTNRVTILPGSSQAKRLANSGIRHPQLTVQF